MSRVTKVYLLATVFSAFGSVLAFSSAPVHHALIKQDYPRDSRDSCEYVSNYADETYLQRLDELGLKHQFVYMGLGKVCDLRIIFWPEKETQIPDFNQFITDKQDLVFEKKTIHIFRIWSVHADVRITGGITNILTPFPGHWEQVITHVVRPTAFSNMLEYNKYVHENIAQRLKVILSDPRPFLDYLAKEFSPEYAKQYEEKFLKQINMIDLWARPYLGLDDTNLDRLPYESASFVACTKGFPKCTLGK